jgi:hypothetical protein
VWAAHSVSYRKTHVGATLPLPELGMSLLSLVIVYAGVFAVCEWSGLQLARHYQDAREVTAVMAIGASVLDSLAVLSRLGLLEHMLLTAGLVAAGGGGLLAGHMRCDHRI